MKIRASLLAILAASLVVATPLAGPPTAQAPLPPTLSATGFHEPGTRAVHPAHDPFEPAFPLWTDGMAKRRWISIPAGASIDKSDPDAWDFPPGTRAWKEFADGARVETRYLERMPDGGWRFATYVWNEGGTDAVLAPAEGIPARGIPSREDCLACHVGAPSPVLGYSAVQLEGTIAARDPRERAALGYLHGNCGHCHNQATLGATGLHFAQSAARPAASAALTRVSLAAQGAEIARRLASPNPYVRMPPLGVNVPDADGLAAIRNYLESL